MTRHASKGVVSLIIPDELRPVSQQTKEPIDFIYNPFGVPSRMNLSQLLEITASKPTWWINKLIRNKPNKVCQLLNQLNETVIKYLGDEDYYQRVNSLITLMKNNPKVKQEFVENVCENNLFIEVPSFNKIDLRGLLKNAYPKANENIVIKKELVKYMKDKLDCFKDLVINQDIVLPNIFCGPIYVQVLYKLVDKLFTSRDFGTLKAITKQPTRGRSLGGGASFGNLAKLKLKIINLTLCLTTLKRKSLIIYQMQMELKSNSTK